MAEADAKPSIAMHRATIATTISLTHAYMITVAFGSQTCIGPTGWRENDLSTVLVPTQNLTWMPQLHTLLNGGKKQMSASLFRQSWFILYCIISFLRLWKSILYGDVSMYRCKPDGTEFLTAMEAFKIAWLVWIK